MIAWRCVNLGLMLLLPGALLSQQTVLVPEDVRCDCVLRAVRIATLSDADGRAGLAGPIAIERLPDGRTVVVPSRRSSELLLFDAVGRFDRRIARSGGGPEEFGAIAGLRIGPGDSLLIMDASNGRLAVLDGELRIARLAALPVMGGWFGVTDQGMSVVLTGIPRADAESLERVRVFDRAMNPVRAFMRAQPIGPGGDIEELRRRMAVSGAGDIALSHTNRYAVEMWDIAGRHLRTFERNPLWLRPPSSTNEPVPLVEEVRIDHGGRIWTVTHVADSRWRDALTPGRDLSGRAILRIAPDRQAWYHDSIIEVLDPESGVLVGRVRIDPQIQLISDDGYGASYREDEVGLPYIDIWHFRLE